MRYTFCLLLMGILSSAFGQETIVVVGSVSARASSQPLSGVPISFICSNDTSIIFSDEEGNFFFRTSNCEEIFLEVQLEHYQSYQTEIQSITGDTSMVLDILMEKKGFELEVVTIQAREVNDLTTISRHRLDIARGKNFAGSLGDIGRALARLPGVANPSDINTGLVIRGNSPVGVSWQIEGMATIDPNHFAAVGNAGGGFSMLNPDMLADISLYTGAFPSQYGDAISGIVDVSLRKGSQEGFRLKAGSNLIEADVSIEGPFSRKKSATFLAAYRRANVDLAVELVPELQTYFLNSPRARDLSFHLNFPDKKGEWAMYGLGGESELEIISDTDDEQLSFYRSKRFSTGVKRSLLVGEQALYTSNLNVSGEFTNNGNPLTPTIRGLEVDNSLLTYSWRNDLSFNLLGEGKLSLGLEARHLRAYILNQSTSLRNGGPQSRIRERDENYEIVRGYVSFERALDDKIGFNLGVYSQYFSLNGTFWADPRINIFWKLTETKVLKLATGIHHQLQLSSYYLLFGKELKPVRSQHIVLSYEETFLQEFQLTLNAYVLKHLSVLVNEELSDRRDFSGLNMGFGVEDGLLGDFRGKSSRGAGQSYGLEVGIEKPFKNGFYGLFTASVYNATYRAQNSQWYPTAFNGYFSYNVLLEKQFPLNKGHNRFLSLSLATTGLGGRRYSVDFFEPFAEQFEPYLRTDVKVTFFTKGDKITQEWSLDVRNAFNQQNELGRFFNARLQDYEIIDQIGILPLIRYDITF